MWWLVRIWVPIAVAVTGVSCMVYVAVQQNYRQSLNDPQIQMAEDGASILALGGTPAEVVPRLSRLPDAASSLAPWIAVYDASTTPLEASASLSGKPPAPPRGIFDSAREGKGKDTSRPNENRVTWEPETGVRQALVVVWEPHSQRFVAAGRNMREVENREWHMQLMLGLGWFAVLLATLLVSWASSRLAMFREA